MMVDTGRIAMRGRGEEEEEGGETRDTYMYFQFLSQALPLNPLPTIASVLTKQKAIYTVLTPTIKILWPYGKFMTQAAYVSLVEHSKA